MPNIQLSFIIWKETFHIKTLPRADLLFKLYKINPDINVVQAIITTVIVFIFFLMCGTLKPINKATTRHAPIIAALENHLSKEMMLKCVK